MKALFELEWNDNLGKDWMNIWNLELLLHSKQFSRKDLVRVSRDLSDYEIVGESNNPDENIHEIILHNKQGGTLKGLEVKSIKTTYGYKREK